LLLNPLVAFTKDVHEFLTGSEFYHRRIQRVHNAHRNGGGIEEEQKSDGRQGDP